MTKRSMAIGLCLLTAFVFSAAMSSTAMAVKLAWWWKNPTTGTIESIPVSKNVTLKATAATSFYLQAETTPRMAIECTGISFVGAEAVNIAGPEGLDKGRIKFMGCKNHEDCLNPAAEFETNALESALGVEAKPNANRIMDGIYNSSKEFAKVRCNGVEAKVMMDAEYGCEWDTSNAAAETIKASHALVCITKRNMSPWCEKPMEEYVDGLGIKGMIGLEAFGAAAILCGTATVTMNEGATNIEWAIR